MKKLVFKTLYIFSSSERLAKKIDFNSNKNIITSSSKDGTKRGKSIIMKSLYHAMGADCYFDDKWNDNSKIYILHFLIDGNGFYIFRTNNLFKFFDSKKNLLFKVVNREYLSVKLKKYTDFAVELPNRKEEKLEITPPAFNYLLYFIDQDYLQGPSFSSFKNLSQYNNYKENVLLYHFGIFTSDYFNIIKELELLNDKIEELNRKKDFYEEMLDKIFSDVKEVSYVKSIDKLRTEIAKFQEQYSDISIALTNIKNELIKLRNDKFDINKSIVELTKFSKHTNTEISYINNEVCPLCKSHIESNNRLLVRKYGVVDDAILMLTRLEALLISTDQEISKKENEYNVWLEKLEKHKNLLEEKNKKINDVIKHQGYMEVKDSLIEEYADIKDSLNQLTEQIKAINKQIKEYNKSKAIINERYYELMLSDKLKFGLEEIDSNKLKKITNVYKAGGSNRPITTVMWYINLIKIKNEFNDSAINFPIVFDSPNNAETDLEKKIEVYKYLIENTDERNQLIVSGIGYGEEEFNNLGFDNVIYLSNNKYELLCSEDYSNNYKLLNELSKK